MVHRAGHHELHQVTQRLVGGTSVSITLPSVNPKRKCNRKLENLNAVRSKCESPLLLRVGYSTMRCSEISGRVASYTVKTDIYLIANR